ncbi:threonine transporter RhtB [Pseudomonas syringae pv. tomato]|uniref:LysE family transporter n=5 Tax=Pseudomonas syringae group TaxID=136849 RepID=A0AAW4E4K6_PSESX|nr:MULTISPECIES: LysE family transporter [Pseudomonas syringae group]AVB17595.1 threonine transporter RhtB [Pseudomonas amygdali pv. morsprunorum]AVI87960.1 threonine transporter RhtB [Pseudomonas syringae pv. tomato]EGH04404.1 cmaU protein [Pseudomonas amygdali pv. aesculi str. 0893_23]EPM42956.1 cmaU protein [Pseudomonas syringae pv. actinidiae ICMP 19073]EPM60319.1 cmaU protein [Pseudomonas syringae pv. actinidiae ICMP 19071]
MFNIMSVLGLLLLMPGPTNTLLLRSGALSGFRHAWSLSLLEYSAYLLQISFWGYLLSHIGDSAPWCLKVVQLASMAYLFKTSHRLWRNPDNPCHSSPNVQISGMYFFRLTLINPKGLLVVSFIAPEQTFTDIKLYLYFVAQLSMVVIPIGCAWVLLGAYIKRSGHAWLTTLNINRTASVIICCFAVAILSQLTDSLIKTKLAF